MSTTGTSRPTPSLRDRRLQVLRRTGASATSRLELEKPSPVFYWILVITAGLVMLGLTMVFSSSSVNSLHTGSSAYGLFWKQVIWVIMGAGAGLALYIFPYQQWARRPFFLMAFCITIVGLNIIVTAKGALINGATAWLDIAGFRFQPSEFMKVATVLFCANFLSTRHRYVEIPSVVLGPIAFVMALTGGLCAAQKDYGSAVIFGGVILAMLFMASLPLRQLFGISGVAAVAGALVLTQASRARDRLLA